MILDLTSEQYHADEIRPGHPSLSASIASILCSRSPLHAWTAHAKLNPNWQRRDEQKFDIGNVCHAYLLQGQDVAEVGQFPDWRTNAAKEWAAQVRENGRIPLLEAQAAAVAEMYAAVAVQLANHAADPPLFSDGKPEQTIVWTDEDNVLCRARLDWLRDDFRAVDDLKTTARSAHPAEYARSLYNVGGDVQAAFYLRGLANLYPDAIPEWRWVVVETASPFALSVIRPGADMLALGDAKVEKAIRVWRECLKTDTWPAYGDTVAEAEMPAWEEAAWMAREAADEVSA